MSCTWAQRSDPPPPPRRCSNPKHSTSEPQRSTFASTATASEIRGVKISNNIYTGTLSLYSVTISMRGSRKFCQRGSTFSKVFFFVYFFFGGGLVDGGIEDQNIAKNGPPSARQHGSFVIFQGIRTSAKKPYIVVIFQGGGSGPPVAPLLKCWIGGSFQNEISIPLDHRLS